MTYVWFTVPPVLFRRTRELAALTAANSFAPIPPPPELASPWVDGTPLSTIVWSELLSPDGEELLPVSRALAMSIPAISRARTLLCSTLARLPIVPVNERTLEPLGDAAPAEAWALLDQFDPAQSRYIQLLWTIDDLIFQGVSWWLVLDRYAETGRPRALRRLLPGAVTIDDGGVLKVNNHVTPARDLVRIDGPHEGIVNFAAATIRSARKLEQSAARFSANPVPAIELHQTDDFPMTDPEIDALVTKWADARAGKNGGVAYTSRNIEAKVHGAPAEHLLTVGRNQAAIDSARHIGVPADAVDAAPEKSTMTYANAEVRLRVLIDFGLAAYGSAITARLSMDDVLPRGTGAAFDYEHLTAATDAAPETSAPSTAAPEAAP